MKYEEPINRRVMRQYLIGPISLGVLLLFAISTSIYFRSTSEARLDSLRLGAFLLLAVSFVGVVLVSLRKLFQELIQAKDYFSSIFGSMSNLVIVTDSKGVIRTLNKATILKLGFSEVDLRGKPIENILSKKEESPFSFEGDTTQRDYLRDFEVSLCTKSGEVIPVLVSSSLLKNSLGQSVGMVCVAQDITERKKAEAEKQDMQAQLIQASKLASLGTIGSGVAHELNNPLTIVKANAEIIRDNTEDAEVQQLVGEIIHSASRMKKITDHLRTFARESKKDDWQQIDVSQPIRDSLVLLKQKLRTDDIELKIDLAPDLPAIWGDSNQLESVFQNLLTNSRDAFEGVTDGRQKTIEMTTELDESGGILFTYRDNATGMPQKVIDRIFDPFFTTKEVGKGTGLGMSILHGIVQKHRGKLTLESTEGVGTCFRINFPADRRSGSREAKPVAASVSTPVKQLVVEGPLPKILIVDDELKIANLLKLILKKCFEAEVPDDSEIGIERIKTQKYDLVVTDLQMPRFSGLDILNAVKEFQPDTPVVLMTGNGDGDAKVKQALSSGVVAVLDKPFKDPRTVQDFLYSIVRGEEKKSVA